MIDRHLENLRSFIKDLDVKDIDFVVGTMLYERKLKLAQMNQAVHALFFYVCDSCNRTFPYPYTLNCDRCNTKKKLRMVERRHNQDEILGDLK